jgi:hypothetical protein
MLTIVHTAVANIFIPLTLGSGIRNTTINPNGMPCPMLEVEGMYFHAIGDVGGASYENYWNDPVQKMESLIQSIMFLGGILYMVWAQCGRLVPAAWPEQVGSLGLGQVGCLGQAGCPGRHLGHRGHP